MAFIREQFLNAGVAPQEIERAAVIGEEILQHGDVKGLIVTGVLPRLDSTLSSGMSAFPSWTVGESREPLP